MKLKYITFLPFIVFYAYAQNPLYQECSNDPFTLRLENHMDRFLNSIEPSNDPFEEQSVITHTTDILINSDFSSIINRDFSYIAPICFYASSLRGKHNLTSSQLYYCQSEEDSSPQNSHNNTGPCLSENYIQKLSSTFEELSRCFELSDQDSNILFEILNHESAFIPNARSSTGARCMGQLTIDSVLELTAQLTIEMYDEERFDSISNNLSIDKCPHLHELTLPAHIQTSILPQVEQMNPSSLYDNIKKVIRENTNFTCPLVSNPVRCLLYSFLYYKNSLNHFNKIFEPQNDSLPSELLEDSNFEFKTNITNNELLVLNDELSSTKMVFMSTAGAYTNGFKNYPLSSIQKVEIIDEVLQSGYLQTDMDRFKKLAIRLSYNGGIVITQFLVKEFLFELKRNISNANAIGLYGEFREQILNGKSVPFERMIQLFYRYIRSESNEIKSNWDRIGHYSSQIDRDIYYMNTQDTSFQNPINLHFQRIKEQEIGTPIPLDWIGAFSQKVQSACYHFEALED